MSVHEAAKAAMAEWVKQGGSFYLDTMRDALYELIDDAVTEFGEEHPECAETEEDDDA